MVDLGKKIDNVRELIDFVSQGSSVQKQKEEITRKNNMFFDKYNDFFYLFSSHAMLQKNILILKFRLNIYLKICKRLPYRLLSIKILLKRRNKPMGTKTMNTAWT